MLQVGNKVICIVHWEPWSNSYLYNYANGKPIKDKVYVICGFYTHNFSNILGLKLIGLPVFAKKEGIEMGWDAKAFRKLEDIQEVNKLKQEIKELKQITDPVKAIMKELQSNQ